MGEIGIFIDAFMQSAYATKLMLFLIIAGGIYAYKKLNNGVVYSIYFAKAIDKGFEKVIANGKGTQYAEERDDELERLYTESEKKKVNFNPLKK